MTEIITRIPPAYFIPIEGYGIEPFRYINAAKIESIDVGETGLVSIYMESDTLHLSGDRAKAFLEEIKQMCVKYGGKNRRSA